MRNRRLFNSIPRSQRSMMLANIILDKQLFHDWRIYCIQHPKLKSKYRAANLFLLSKKLRYHCPDVVIREVNMDNIEDYYYA